MLKYSGQKIVAMLEGRHGTREDLAEFLEHGSEGHKPPVLGDFSLRDLAEQICGETRWWKDLCRRFGGGGARGGAILLEGRDFMESGVGATLYDFKDIIGQLLINQIKDGFMAEEYKLSKYVPVVQSKILDTEKIPEIGVFGDEAQTVLEGQEIPTVGYGSNYYTWPAAFKKALITEITAEALFADLTKRVTDPATKLGKVLGLSKEISLIQAFIGYVDSYSRNGTATSTWLTTGAYVNASVIALLDETDVEEVEQAMVDILHPETGLPIELLEGQTQLVCVPALKRTALRIKNGLEVRETNGTVETIAPPTIAHDFEVVSSKLLYQQINTYVQTNATKAKTWWFLCALAELLAWKENWAPFGATQGPDSNSAFERDVQFRWKGEFRGVAVVNEPRAGYRCGDAS